MGPVSPQHRCQEVGWHPRNPTRSHLLLNSRDVSGLKVASSEQIWCEPSSKQEPFLGHLHQDESDQLSHVHPADHLLKPAQGGSARRLVWLRVLRGGRRLTLKTLGRPKHKLGDLLLESLIPSLRIYSHVDRTIILQGELRAT